MKISEIIDVNKPIYAHRQNDRLEKLYDHSQLCLKYFDRLIEEKKLRKCFERIFKIYFGDDAEFETAFRLLRDMAELHDMGKIDPEFQKVKMENEQPDCKNYKSSVGSNHSLISAVIYTDQELSLVDNGDSKGERVKKIKGLILLNAYIISRHHSGLTAYHEFESAFNAGEIGYSIVKEFEDTDIPGFYGLKSLSSDKIESISKNFTKAMRKSKRDEYLAIFTYCRLAYSLLVASDYYSTTEFINGIEVRDLGQIEDIEDLTEDFEASDVVKSIRKYEKSDYGKRSDFSDVTDINIMRNEMFLDAEKNLEQIKSNDIFYLEAPTGSGKSNVAINLSLKLLNDDVRKIYYIYPYNTLIEQNIDVLHRSFSGKTRTMEKMAVINAITPIAYKKKGKDDENDEEKDSELFQKALLDRQFQNYPLILSTHVSLFRTMFGTKREDLFSFFQLADSVIVLDEIQSYKNTIWSEIIVFLEHFAKLLNIKVIIMSATLPNLSVLSEEGKASVNILYDREKFFRHYLFARRVEISYELLKIEFTIEMLAAHIAGKQDKGKILVEFINKDRAYEFYEMLKSDPKITSEVLLMTGDDNSIARKNMIEHVKEEGIKVILVATQVIEAGVDIDMDIGYKDISKLDSEEQFIGRLNRSCKHNGKVYFFNCDECSKIYKNDERTNARYTLANDEMREILDTKDFGRYYSYVMELLKKNHRDVSTEEGLNDFMEKKVRTLSFCDIEERMKLIDDDDWKVSVFFNLEKGKENNNTEIDPESVWNEYKALLSNNDMDYSERIVKLSEVKSQLYNFIYEITDKYDIPYNDSIGDLLYVHDGDQYFSNGKLIREKIEKGGTII